MPVPRPAGSGRNGVAVSVSVWIVNLVVLAVVLEADLGHKISRFRLIRPLVLGAVVAAFYIGGIVGTGTSLWLELGGVGAGIVLGLAASALMRVESSVPSCSPAGSQARPRPPT